MALAHAGTKNPIVKAWMANMKKIGAETKKLGLMAREKTAFDVKAVNAALDRLAILSAEVPALFVLPAEDPTSEARALIWTNWDDYQLEAEAFAQVVRSAKVTTKDDLATAFKEIGGTCTSCHGKYRD